MKTKQLQVGDKLYFISQSGFISIEPITRINNNIAYSGGVSFELDISNGSLTVIKNTGIQGEYHLPMKELDKMYKDQNIKAQFESAMIKLRHRTLRNNLSTDQMERILSILSE